MYTSTDAARPRSPPASWDGLEALRCNMAGWLWLPPTAPWAEVAAAAAERQAALHARCLAAAVSAFNHDTAGSGQALTADAAAALPWDQLPPRVQLLLICELHDTLATRFRQRQRGGSCEGATAADLLAGAAKQAPAFLHWLDSQRRQGRAVDEQTYLAACAATHAASEQSQSTGGGSRGGGGSRSGADPERQRRLVRVGLAFQQAMRRLNLVALSDLPLLARQLLAAGGAAAAWARRRWSVVLVVRQRGGVGGGGQGLLRCPLISMRCAWLTWLLCRPCAGRVPGHRACAGEHADAHARLPCR